MSNFEFEFLFRICRRIFDSGFEFKFLEFSCRILNSPFSFRCSIRLLEFRCSIRFLESDFEFVVEFDFSNFVSNFKFEFVVEICRRNFRFVALFDFSKLEFSIRISNSSFSFRRSIRFLEFRCSIRLLEIDRQIRLLEVRLLEFRFAISIRNFDDRQVLELLFSKSHSSFEFLIELFNFRRNRAICIALMH